MVNKPLISSCFWWDRLVGVGGPAIKTNKEPRWLNLQKLAQNRMQKLTPLVVRRVLDPDLQ